MTATTTARPNVVTTTLRHWTPPVVAGTEQADRAAGTMLEIHRALEALTADNPAALLYARAMVERKVRAAGAAYPELRRVPDPNEDPAEWEDEPVPLVWECPWCSRTTRGVSVVDTADRWTTSDADGSDDATRTIGFFYDGQGDFDSLHYQSACCDKPVSLPDGWEEV